MKTSDHSDLNDMRLCVDSTDKMLLSLLADRLDTCDIIGRLKEDMRLPTDQPEREARIIADLRREAQRLGLDPEFVRQLWTLILGESRARQNRQRRITSAT
jgi:chorismate mutase-like protein